MPKSIKDPDISIIIRAYNEEKFIANKLSNLIPRLKHTSSKAEIIMAVQGNDNSYKIACGFKKDFKELYIYKVPKGFESSTNFLINKARSDIIVVDDADNIFKGDIDRIVGLFAYKQLGGIIQFDVATREWLNKGAEIFDNVYHAVQLAHHSNGRIVTDPIFSVHFFRKSALNKPYITTVNDDSEICFNLLKNGYDVIYDRQLSFSIFKRRIRTEMFRRQAKEMLKTDRFTIGNRSSEFNEAILMTFQHTNIIEALQVIEYIAVVVMATITARILIMFKKDRGYVQIR